MEKEIPSPFFRHHVFCCTNVRPETHPMDSCGRHGSLDLQKYLKDQVREMELEGVRINSSSCLGRCDNAPVIVVYPEGVWYRCENREDADRVLADHLRGGNPVKHLMLDGSE